MEGDNQGFNVISQALLTDEVSVSRPITDRITERTHNSGKELVCPDMRALMDPL